MTGPKSSSSSSRKHVNANVLNKVNVFHAMSSKHRTNVSGRKSRKIRTHKKATNIKSRTNTVKCTGCDEEYFESVVWFGLSLLLVVVWLLFIDDFLLLESVFCITARYTCKHLARKIGIASKKEELFCKLTSRYTNTTFFMYVCFCFYKFKRIKNEGDDD